MNDIVRYMYYLNLAMEDPLCNVIWIKYEMKSSETEVWGWGTGVNYYLGTVQRDSSARRL